jgi:hypothetical protein
MSGSLNIGSYEDLTYRVLSRKYDDANIQFIQDYYNSKLEQAESKNSKILIDLYKEKILESVRDYNGISRNIVIRTIPKGTLLYHYYQNNYYEERNNVKIKRDTFSKQSLIRYYSRFGFQSIQYNEADDSVSFELSRSLASPKYFFGVPHAVYGVFQGETVYNTMIPVVVKEDMHIAFLKSGADINDQSILHRGYPSKYFNFQRVTECSSLKTCEDNVCNYGSSEDMCLRKEFAKTEKLDGIAAIAAMDSLYDEDGRPQGLYRAIKEYIEQIKPTQTEIEINVLNMILLALDYDMRDTRIIEGFTEYALHPFGKKGYRGEHFLPPSTNSLYTIIEEVAGERQRIQTSFANFKAVFEQYIKPNLIVDPLCVLDITRSNKNAALSDTEPEFMYNLITPGQYPSRFNSVSKDYPTIDPIVFFEWLLDNKYTLLYNPLINMFGIFKDKYAFSYPPGNFKYRNEVIVNKKLPNKDIVERDFTNISIGRLLHVLTFTDPTGTFNLHSHTITSALEIKLFKSTLNKSFVDSDGTLITELKTIYHYQPVWNANNIIEDKMPNDDSKQALPKFIVYAGNRKEIPTLFRILRSFYTGLHSEFILDVNNDDYEYYINTYKNKDYKRERLEKRKGKNAVAHIEYVVLGTITPPTVENQINQQNTNNTTNLSKGRGGRRRKTRRRRERQTRKQTKRGRTRTK